MSCAGTATPEEPYETSKNRTTGNPKKPCAVLPQRVEWVGMSGYF